MDPQTPAALRCYPTLVIYRVLHCVPPGQNVGIHERGSSSVNYFCFSVGSKSEAPVRETLITADCCSLLPRRLATLSERQTPLKLPLRPYQVLDLFPEL